MISYRLERSDSMKANYKPLVTIVITTKNSAKILENLFKSIKKQTYHNLEIVVVDNFSSDQTEEISKKYTHRFFKKGPERSAQRNYAVQRSKGKYVLILDSDMELQKKVIEECVTEFDDGKFGALVVPEKSFGMGFWTKFKAFEREFYVGEQDFEAARFFKRSLFQKFGGYDQSLTGPEDWDLPLRMRKAGIKIGRIKSYILHNELVFSPWRSAKKKFYYGSKANSYLKRHPEMAISQGNLLFRNVFFRKWKRLLFHPFLAFGLFCVSMLEASGAIAGFLWSLLSKKEVVNLGLYKKDD